MNFRELILPLALSTLFVWSLNKFFAPTDVTASAEAKSGQSFKTVSTAEAARPLLLIASLSNACSPEQNSFVVGDASIIFDEETAALSQITYARARGSTTISLPVIESQNSIQSAYLVAFDETIPCTFIRTGIEQAENTLTLNYSGKYQDAAIDKRFTFLPQKGLIELTLTIKPGSEPMSPRIIIPSPHDTVRSPSRGVVLSDTGSVSIIPAKKVADTFWVKPELFGGDTAYALSALVKDPNNFARRGYYSTGSDGRLITIIEGPEITTPHTWHMTFFCAPKEISLISAVDPRLEETLEYGWFGSLVKLLLKILSTLNEFVGNYGVSIIIVTIGLQLILMPSMMLTGGSEGATRRRAEYDKKMRYIEQKYKDNPHVLAQEKLELMRKMGPSYKEALGCLPLLVQIPVFIALNRLLSTSVDLYGAPFFGWITDLSVKDPYYVLPVILAVASFWRGASSATDARTSVLMFILAILLGAFATSFSAGLNLFLVTAALVGAGQMWIISKLKRS